MNRNLKKYKAKQRKLNLYQKFLRAKPTLGEQIFIEKCQYYEINYIFQRGFIAGNGFCIADFYLPKYRLVVEIDGKYHNTPKQKIRDYFKDKYYKARRLNILRIKEEDVESFNIVLFLDNPKPTYTQGQYENLKKQKIAKAKKKESQKRLKQLRERHPYA